MRRCPKMIPSSSWGTAVSFRREEYQGYVGICLIIIFGIMLKAPSNSVMQAGAAPCAHYAQLVNGYEHSHDNCGNPYSHVDGRINGGLVGVGGPMPKYFSYSQYQQHIQQYQQPTPHSSLVTASNPLQASRGPT
ncbi:uncharacterized protein A4U43_C07F11910 [Asparagus officinalis]|uniref:Uncharacterized protein n=1 Tax=Asparagus officinalis TaxID=4686 RepID=A0A5P1EBB0_ASPOF|nr:uncharacterized protein A4U43_C07F11910 [Asparagus officinalis]